MRRCRDRRRSERPERWASAGAERGLKAEELLEFADRVDHRGGFDGAEFVGAGGSPGDADAADAGRLRGAHVDHGVPDVDGGVGVRTDPVQGVQQRLG